MNQYYVIKRSAGYPVKAFTSEERKGKERKGKKRMFSTNCCKKNKNTDYIVYVAERGLFVEI